MESLLSVSFDNISSKDITKIRKGLRQIESLLAQICLNNGSAGAHQPQSAVKESNRRQSAMLLDAAPKTLQALSDDLAFREFFRLQESFEWNVATRLTETLERLLGLRSSAPTDALIISALDLTRGVLLLHPGSRALFAREVYMALLLDLLDPANAPAILRAALLVLVAALLDRSRNVRAFERADGLATVAAVFRSKDVGQETRMRVLEFFYFYLMPEGPVVPVQGQGQQAVGEMRRSPSKVTPVRIASDTSTSDAGVGSMKSTAEKQALLGKYVPNVQELVNDLAEAAPFTDAVVQTRSSSEQRIMTGVVA